MLCITLYIRAPVDSSGFLSLIGLLCLNKGVYLSIFRSDHNDFTCSLYPIFNEIY